MKIFNSFTLFKFIGGFLALFMPLVSLSTMQTPNTLFTIFQDFKAVLMFYSEAFLKGAKFGDESLEGEIALVMAGKLIHVLKDLENEQSTETQAKMTALNNFTAYLQSGLSIATEIQSFSSLDYPLIENYSCTIAKAREIQESLTNRIGIDRNVVLPSGWIGHAIVLIIELERVDENNQQFYNLTVVNTGQGLGHHYHRMDPDKIYPHLSRLWIQFKNIPRNEIFDADTAWLIYGLASIQRKDFVSNINNGVPISDYFYDSLLANFVDYLVQPEKDEIDKKLVPEQLSGSCTMSSLMGALLYYSDSFTSYHWYRLKIGQSLLDGFLNRLQLALNSKLPVVAENQFRNVLSDGFFSGGLLLFKGLIRALAKEQLKYLEHMHPNEFKGAGLISSERSSWVNDRKEQAILALSKDETSRQEILKTIKLAKTIHEIASKVIFRSETTHITIEDKFKFSNRTLSNFSYKSKTEVRQDAAELFTLSSPAGSLYLNFLAGDPERIVNSNVPISTFNDFYNSFRKLFFMLDDSKELYFIRFLDIFKRLHLGSGWNLILNHNERSELSQLQRWCKHLALKFVQLSTNYAENKERRRTSLDEIALLMQLQLLSWNLFKNLHMKIFPDSRVDWSKLYPPRTVQNVLLRFEKDLNYISGNFEELPIKGFRDIDNLKLLRPFILDGGPQDSDIKSNHSRFPGPEVYINREYFYHF